ncbi:uncharacterized protein LOC124426324 [Vespa crabro]|uniref:uncharacterized protein LOC124426324 n=1 Tax=Vespa crabro TaxID=7445 RepID=UPI001F024C5F|nr:uncharacterized protein LOC124426324 [Vespa crabro]
MDRHEINEFSCPSRRSRRRRSSRRRCRSVRRACRRVQRRRRNSCRRRARRRSACKRRRSRRRKRSSGRRCSNSDINEMEAISKQPRTNNQDDDDSNSRNESISDRSSLTDPDGSMQDPRSITPPITHMD